MWCHLPIISPDDFGMEVATFPQSSERQTCKSRASRIHENFCISFCIFTKMGFKNDDLPCRQPVRWCYEGPHLQNHNHPIVSVMHQLFAALLSCSLQGDQNKRRTNLFSRQEDLKSHCSYFANFMAYNLISSLLLSERFCIPGGRKSGQLQVHDLVGSSGYAFAAQKDTCRADRSGFTNVWSEEKWKKLSVLYHRN